MQKNEISNANPHGSDGVPHPDFQLSAKLRERLEKLTRWRIDPSGIEFPGDAHEFRGGNATVSRALLASPHNIQVSPNEPEHTRDGRSDSEKRKKKPGDEDEARKSADPIPKPKVAVAVKKLNVENNADLERVLGLALRESEFVLGLWHPNVTGYRGFVEDVSKHMIWLVFPWEENGNLRDFLASGEWEIPERISLICDVAQGIQYLHSQTPPIYHGDLKSLNVLVSSSYYAVITDFGSARRLGAKAFDQRAKKRDPQPRPEQTAGEESNTLHVVYSAFTNTITLTSNRYTLRWAAPELLMDDTPGLPCDIWALGCIAYEVMTNTIPFHDVKRDVAVITRVIQGDLPSITDHARISLSQSLCSLMAQCWSVDPQKRPTALECIKSIVWMPRIAPAPNLAGDSEASRTREAVLLLQLGEMYKQQSDYVNAADCFTKALNIFVTTDDITGKAAALWRLAEVHRCRAEYSKAAGFYSESLQHATHVGDRGRRDAALWGLAEVHLHLGEYTKSANLYSEVLRSCTETGNQMMRGDVLWGLAEICRLRGEYNEAIKLLSECLQIRTEIGFSVGRASVLWSLGEVHRRQREDSEAFKFYSESLQVYIDMGDKGGQVEALGGLGEVHLSRKEYDDAASVFSKALQIATDTGSKSYRADILFGLAKTHRMQGHRSESISFSMDASKAFREVGQFHREAQVLKWVADLRSEEAR